MLYDDVLGITWLQDANYAKTSGYSDTIGYPSHGSLKWNDAKTWTENLVYGGYSDWRLPKVILGTPLVNGVDFSYIAPTVNSELGYMFLVNLGLKSSRLPYPSTTLQPDYGVHRNGTSGGQENIGLVINLRSDPYWYGNSWQAPSTDTHAWGFNYYSGAQGGWLKTSSSYVWAVRDGDVASVAAPIPEPESYAMLLAGLGLVGFIARRRNRRPA